MDIFMQALKYVLREFKDAMFDVLWILAIIITVASIGAYLV